MLFDGESAFKVLQSAIVCEEIWECRDEQMEACIRSAHGIALFERKPYDVSDSYRRKRLFKVKFHLLDHLVEDESPFEVLGQLDNALLRYLNAI